MSTRSMIFVELKSEDLGKEVKPDKNLIYARDLQFENIDDGSRIAEEEVDKFSAVLLRKRYIGIYHHFDGHPMDVGVSLIENFNSYKEALNLMLYGSESTIIDTVKPYKLRGGSYVYEEDDDPVQEEEIPTDLAYTCWADYIYLFSNGVWMYSTAFPDKDTGKYYWRFLQESLIIAGVEEIIRPKSVNCYDTVGPMLIRAKASDIKHFFVNAYNITLARSNNTIPLIHGWHCINSAKKAYITPIKTYDLTDTVWEDVIVPVLYKQAYDVHVDTLMKIANRYNADLRTFACDDSMTICRNIEIIDGKITKNEFIIPVKDEDPHKWLADLKFGDTAIQNRRAYRWKCEMSPEIPTAQSELLKAVANEQDQRYIPKCPCCGQDEMFTYAGKTDGWPSRTAGIYICDHCGCKESEQEIRPLSKWAVFNPVKSGIFLPQTTYNPVSRT